MNKKLETIESYNKGASALSKKFNEIGPRIKDIEDGLSYVNKENPKVLELGCGDGRDAKIILKHTNNYLGIDVSKEMIRLAEEHAPEGNFKVADIEEFNFPGNVDIMFAFASLLHFNKESFREILDKAHSSLNTDGIFYISVKYDIYQEKIEIEEFGPRVFYYYTEEDIVELAKDKYQVIKTNTQVLRGTKWLVVVLKNK